MNRIFLRNKLTSFRMIILGFLGVILTGTFLLTLPFSAKNGCWTPFMDALFTSTSAVCVTGLVVKDTATYWSMFGQTVILILIQIGGLGVISIAAFVATVSGRKISLFQRSMLQDSISAHQIGGVVKMNSFVFRAVFVVELLGAVVMMPSFCTRFGVKGVWMAFFHSISAFCNAGFDVMGSSTGKFSSLTAFSDNPGIVLPIVLLIMVGGIGFLTWDDIARNSYHFKRYRLQTKLILVTTAVLILAPTIHFFFGEFSGWPLGERLCLSLFQAVTPRTAGFNTADLSLMTDSGHMILIVLMLIGGSPGSTAGGMKTTTVAVLMANSLATFRRKKNAHMFGRRIEDNTIKNASTLLVMYLTLCSLGALIIGTVEKLPMKMCIFETASAIGTVGLTLGITTSLGLVSRLILILLMFFGRVGGLTLIYATIRSLGAEVSRYPVEKINVG